MEVSTGHTTDYPLLLSTSAPLLLPPLFPTLPGLSWVKEVVLVSVPGEGIGHVAGVEAHDALYKAEPLGGDAVGIDVVQERELLLTD